MNEEQPTGRVSSPEAESGTGTIDVILPVLNEAESLPWVLGRFSGNFQPIVVDNGSDDGSAAIASGLGARVVPADVRGFGSACWEGLNSSTAEVVCFMDADGSLDPADLPKVAAPVVAGQSDLCMGRRIASRGAMGLHSRVGNAVIAFEVRRRTGLEIRDLGPMRCARRSELLSLGIRDRRFGWPLEMVILATQSGWRVSEVDVPYGLRVGGKSKVTGTLKGTVRTVRDMSRILP